MDYYKILNINKNASKDDIKKAYIKLVKQYHPDKNDSQYSKDKFNQIKNAYEILLKETENKKYISSYKEDFYKTNINTEVEITYNESLSGTYRKIEIFDKGFFINQNIKIPKGIKDGQTIRLKKEKVDVIIKVYVI
jgi:chaperone protein DnaJ